MKANSAHSPAAGMPRITNPMPSRTATMPPKTVATPKYRRVPLANLPSAPSTGSWPARTRFIRVTDSWRKTLTSHKYAPIAE